MFAILLQAHTSQLDASNKSNTSEPTPGLEMGPISHVNEPGHTKHTPSSDTFYATSEATVSA